MSTSLGLVTINPATTIPMSLSMNHETKHIYSRVAEAKIIEQAT